MGLKQMGREMDAEEITYQMALDLTEGEEATARRLGVPTVAETMKVSPGRRISAHDPDWFKKLEKMTAR